MRTYYKWPNAVVFTVIIVLALTNCSDDKSNNSSSDDDAVSPEDGSTPSPDDASAVEAMPELEGPITGPGEMFIDGLEKNLTVSVQDLGYVFEEYFVSGTAADASYRVRLLIARPDRSDVSFSGHVIVEPKHATGMPFIWYFTREYLASEGHAAVEITTFPSTIDRTLKEANPERYADLHVSDEQASDIFAQVGRLLKSDQTPLPGVHWLYMTGHSMASAPVWHFMDAHHEIHRLADGGPIFDGFFPETSASASRLGPFPDVDVPAILINSESEVEGVIIGLGINYRKPDSDEPGKAFRLYEVAGMMHNPSWMNPVSIAVGVGEGCERPPNSFPYNATVSMALDHLMRWVADGVSPPHAEPIALVGTADDPVEIERDEHGNALGGVRSSTLDVPVATHDAINSGPMSCSAFGSQQDFSKEKLVELYGDHAGYVEQVNQRLDELIDEGWVLPLFADRLRAEAEAFTGFE